MPEVILCKETAQAQIKKFASAWGLYDAKSIISGGAESSIPPEMTELLLAAVMTGDVEISEDGKTLTHNLAEAVDNVDKAVFKRMKIKKHMMTEIMELPENDQLLAIAQRVSEMTTLTLSELSTRDLGITSALATHISFT